MLSMVAFCTGAGFLASNKSGIYTQTYCTYNRSCCGRKFLLEKAPHGARVTPLTPIGAGLPNHLVHILADRNSPTTEWYAMRPALPAGGGVASGEAIASAPRDSELRRYRTGPRSEGIGYQYWPCPYYGRTMVRQQFCLWSGCAGDGRTWLDCCLAHFHGHNSSDSQRLGIFGRRVVRRRTARHSLVDGRGLLLITGIGNVCRGRRQTVTIYSSKVAEK